MECQCSGIPFITLRCMNGNRHYLIQFLYRNLKCILLCKKRIWKYPVTFIVRRVIYISQIDPVISPSAQCYCCRHLSILYRHYTVCDTDHLSTGFGIHLIVSVCQGLIFCFLCCYRYLTCGFNLCTFRVIKCCCYLCSSCFHCSQLSL